MVLRGSGHKHMLGDTLSSARPEEVLQDIHLHPHHLFVGLPCTDVLLCLYRVTADTLPALQLYFNSEGQKHF